MISMLYQKFTNIFGTKPLKSMKNAIKVLLLMGPGEFWIRTHRKARTGDAEAPIETSAMLSLSEQYQLYIEKNTLTRNDFGRMQGEIASFAYKPLISIVMPVYNVDEEYLIK